MAGILQVFLLFLFYNTSAVGLNVQLTSSEDEAPMPKTYNMHTLELDKPYGGVYKGSYNLRGHFDEPDFENFHVASKRPFGGIYGKPYKFRKREFPPLEGHYEMKRPFGKIYGNFMKEKFVSGDHAEFKRPFGSVYGNAFKTGKRPFGSIYGQSDNMGKLPFASIYGQTHDMGKRPFGSVYGQSFSMGKRPFGGVYRNSQKIGKRYTSPLVHDEVKRPFGKVYGKLYKIGKRPFGQIYGKNYGKRSLNKYNQVPEMLMPFADGTSFHPDSEDRRGQKAYASRPFGRIPNSDTILGRHHGEKNEFFTEKRPFGQIYSKSRPFGKRSFHGTNDYPNDILMLSKRPFGRVYGKSYKLWKRPLKKHDFRKRSSYRPVVAVVDEHERPLILKVANDQDEDYPLFVENNVSEDLDPKNLGQITTNDASDGYKTYILDSSSLFPVFVNIEDEENHDRLHKNDEEESEENASGEGGDFDINDHDGNERSDYDESLAAVVPRLF
ncbi:uncharacterized protein LOC133196650 [Saccostrea echinata]|uniref:uncharacterized protein LOC133196650 n=1 Tax=Saccostrea echinata TaxID=191078 RepID=UPI002A81719B|nr:uncharacterized protein LOC133196650 [Saccostrea echinata]